jgi:hypothetical protein
VAPLHIRNTILLLSTVRSILCLMGVAYVFKTIDRLKSRQKQNKKCLTELHARAQAQTHAVRSHSNMLATHTRASLASKQASMRRVVHPARPPTGQSPRAPTPARPPRISPHTRMHSSMDVNPLHGRRVHMHEYAKPCMFLHTHHTCTS